ncbi:hypothetical protein ACFQ71_09580 [Streptomyces sp. NPDC056534]|uniref:hypothetical protein n=1 Tax=Streptomyces sp. NPDC056534 TaxID=3345857 RepID=UPI003680DE07
MSKQHYNAEVQVRTPSGELATIYTDSTGPAGMSAAQVRARAEKAALAEVPGGRVEGSRVSTDGRRF